MDDYVEAPILIGRVIIACEAGGDADAGEQGLEVVKPDVRPRRCAVLPVARGPAWHDSRVVSLCACRAVASTAARTSKHPLASLWGRVVLKTTVRIRAHRSERPALRAAQFIGAAAPFWPSATEPGAVGSVAVCALRVDSSSPSVSASSGDLGWLPASASGAASSSEGSPHTMASSHCVACSACAADAFSDLHADVSRMMLLQRATALLCCVQMLRPTIPDRTTAHTQYTTEEIL